MSPKAVGWGLILLGIIGFAQLAHCQSFGDRLYRTSVMVAIGAQGADIASSWGGIEVGLFWAAHEVIKAFLP